MVPKRIEESMSNKPAYEELAHQVKDLCVELEIVKNIQLTN